MPKLFSLFVDIGGAFSVGIEGFERGDSLDAVKAVGIVV